jgi:hypothetical protein
MKKDTESPQQREKLLAARVPPEVALAFQMSLLREHLSFARWLNQHIQAWLRSHAVEE